MQLNRYLIGWISYFRLALAKGHCEKFDQWIRRRLRMCLWKQRKHGCAPESVSSEHLGSQNGHAALWLIPGEERGKCLETQITPFRHAIVRIKLPKMVIGLHYLYAGPDFTIIWSINRVLQVNQRLAH